MSSAGKLRDRVSFHRLNTTADAYGNTTSGFDPTPLFTSWGELNERAGRERDGAGRLQSEVMSWLRVRADSATTETVTEADKAVIGGVDYQIRSIRVEDRRNRFLIMELERGVAV